MKFPKAEYSVLTEAILNDMGILQVDALQILNCSRDKLNNALVNGVLTKHHDTKLIDPKSILELVEYLDRSVTVGELAETLDISRATANRCVERGDIESAKLWGTRVLKSHVADYRMKNILRR